MKYMVFDLPLKAVDLYPIGDWHHGSRQSFPRFIRQLVDEIRDNPEARWVSMGDLAENAIVGSKSDVYLATKNPEEQLEDLQKLLEPIRDKCLFMIPGNHGLRSHRQVGLDPDAVLAKLLRVPYARYSVLASLMFREVKAPNRAVCYFHHSRGGGSTDGGKVNSVAKLRLICPEADAVFAAHTHITSRIPTTWYGAGYKSLIRKTGYNYIIGSALTWKESYAEEKGYRPATIEQICVRFEMRHSGPRHYVKQTYKIVEPS